MNVNCLLFGALGNLPTQIQTSSLSHYLQEVTLMSTQFQELGFEH